MSKAEANWKYNVSKKIAQLTKVIYRLHTESLDRKDRVAFVRQKYDDEMQELRDATEQKILESEALFVERERILQQKIEQQNGQQIADYETRIAELSSELTELKRKFENMFTIFDSSTVEIQSIHENTINKLTMKHRKEMSELNEQLRLNNEKHSALETELASLTKQNEDKTAEFDFIFKKQRDLQEKSNTLEKENKKLKSAVKTLNSKVESTQKELDDAKKLILKAEKQRDEALSKLSQTIKSHKLEIERLNTSVRPQPKAVLFLSDIIDHEVAEDLSAISALQANVDASKALLHKTKKQLESVSLELIASQKESSNCNKELVLANSKISDLEVTLSLLRAEVQAKRDQLDVEKESRRSESEGMSKQMADLVLQHQEEVTSLQCRYKQLEMAKAKQKNDYKIKSRFLKDRIRDLEAVNNGSEDLKMSISLLETNHAHEVAKLKAQYDSQIQQKDELINELREQLKAAMVERDDTSRVRELEFQLAERTEALARMYTEMKQYQSELVHRETSYNKLFSHDPDVGVLNVIEKRVKRDSARGCLWNLPPLEKEEKSARTSARRKKRVRISTTE